MYEKSNYVLVSSLFYLENNSQIMFDKDNYLHNHTNMYLQRGNTKQELRCLG